MNGSSWNVERVFTRGFDIQFLLKSGTLHRRCIQHSITQETTGTIAFDLAIVDSVTRERLVHTNLSSEMPRLEEDRRVATAYPRRNRSILRRGWNLVLTVLGTITLFYIMNNISRKDYKVSVSCSHRDTNPCYGGSLSILIVHSLRPTFPASFVDSP